MKRVHRGSERDQRGEGAVSPWSWGARGPRRTRSDRTRVQEAGVTGTTTKQELCANPELQDLVQLPAQSDERFYCPISQMKRRGWQRYAFCQEHMADEGGAKTETQSCLTSQPTILTTINLTLTLEYGAW